MSCAEMAAAPVAVWHPFVKGAARNPSNFLQEVRALAIRFPFHKWVPQHDSLLQIGANGANGRWCARQRPN